MGTQSTRKLGIAYILSGLSLIVGYMSNIYVSRRRFLFCFSFYGQ